MANPSDLLKGGSAVARANGRHLLWRYASYLGGFILFYSPGALVLRFVSGLDDQHLIGNLCDSLNLRMGVGGLLNLERWETMQWDVRHASIFVVLAIAFAAGPLFCGWLCAAGAFPEFLGRFVPERLKFDFAGRVHAGAVRYGFLAGYLTLPFLGLHAGCSYCNFRVMEYIGLGFGGGFLPALTSTYIIVSLLWIVVGGLFIKGGRGWCVFLCPVGAIQNLVHAVGARLPFTWKVRFLPEKCRSCDNCIKVCPTRAIVPAPAGAYAAHSGPGVDLSIHTCLTCNQCIAACPHDALTYARGPVARRNAVEFTAPGALLP